MTFYTLIGGILRNFEYPDGYLCNKFKQLLRVLNKRNHLSNYLKMKYFIYIQDGKSNNRMIIKNTY